MSPRLRTIVVDALVSLFLAAMVVVVYHDVLSLYWIYDDAFHLLFIGKHPVQDYFINPAAWRELPFRMYTPLQMASYEIDLNSFGYVPSRFYAHQLVSLGAATALLFYLLRQWFTALYAFIAAATFAFSLPAYSWAEQLMARHYVEGLLFAALSTLAYVQAIRSRRPALTIAGAALYLLAALSKEVFVPLPALLFFLPDGSLADRRRALLPYGVVAAVYCLWRLWMLGAFLGGYGWAVRGSDVLGVVARLPHAVASAAGGSTLAGAVILLFAIGSVVVLGRSHQRARVLLMMGAASALLPLLPVGRGIEGRHAALFWLFVVVCTVAAAHALRPAGTAFAAILLTTLVCSTFALTWVGARESFAKSRRMSIEGRAFVTFGADDVLRQPAIPPASLNALRDLKERVLGGRPGTRWFYDDWYLCAGDVAERAARFWEFQNGAVRRVARIGTIKDRHCAGIRSDAALHVHFTKVGNAVFWDLGPYTDGSYAFLLDNGTQRFTMPPHSGFQVGSSLQLSLKVRYDHPSGWTTYSPELVMDFRKGPFVWRR